MSSRDPFPSPKLEKGFNLSGFRPPQRKIYDKPTHIAQTEEPWSRLYDAATVASTRRSVMHYEHQAPRDSLDFQLKSVYDHNKNFFLTKNQMLYQKETVSEHQRWMFAMLGNRKRSKRQTSECGSILRGAQFTALSEAQVFSNKGYAWENDGSWLHAT